MKIEGSRPCDFQTHLIGDEGGSVVVTHRSGNGEQRSSSTVLHLDLLPGDFLIVEVSGEQPETCDFCGREVPTALLWKYAVLFPGDLTPEKEAAAGELLAELGRAFSLEMDPELESESRRGAGYCALYYGEPSVSPEACRLKGGPRRLMDQLSGSEERVTWPLP